MIVELDDGREVEFPEGMTAAAMAAALKKLPSLTRGSSPLGEAVLNRPPVDTSAQRVQEAAGNFMKDPSAGQNFLQRLISGGGMAASMALPGLLAPVMGGSRLLGPLAVRPALNVLGQGAIGAGESALKGQSPFSGGLTAGGGQAAMEALATPFRVKGMAKSGAALQRGYKEAEAAREAGTDAMNADIQRKYQNQVAGEAADYESRASISGAANEYNQGVFAGATRAAREQKASEVVQKLKETTPAFADYPETTEGLYRIVKGDGLQRASQAFDSSLKALSESARYADPIQIRLEDAQKLKIPIQGQVGPVISETGEPMMVAVNAQELVNKTVGAWRKDKGLYSRMTEALEQAGLVDSEARGAYKSAIGHIEFIDNARLLEGGEFRPDKILPAMEKSNKTLDLLRKRDLGDYFKGNMAEAGRGLPEVPPEFPSPLKPIERTPPPEIPFEAGPLNSPDVTMIGKPHVSPYTLGALGGGIGALMGPGGHTAGGILGGLTGLGVGTGMGMLPSKIPMGDLADDALSMSGMDIPTLLQTIIREQSGY